MFPPRGSSSSYTFIVWEFTPTRPAVVGGTPVKAGVAIRTFHTQHDRTVVHHGGFTIVVVVVVVVGQCFSSRSTTSWEAIKSREE
jgi:hypothetical protein